MKPDENSVDPDQLASKSQLIRILNVTPTACDFIIHEIIKHEIQNCIIFRNELNGTRSDMSGMVFPQP